MAITWKNVTLGDDGSRDSAYSMLGASNSLNSAFDSINKVVEGRQQNIETQYKKAGVANDNAVQDIFAKYTNPAELAKAQQDGTLAAELSMYAGNPNANQAAIRDGGQKRLTQLQTQGEEQAQYQSRLATEAAKPYVDKWNAASNEGDTATMDRMRADPEIWGLFTAAGVGNDATDERLSDRTARLSAKEQLRQQTRQIGLDEILDGQTAADEAAKVPRDKYRTAILEGRDEDAEGILSENGDIFAASTGGMSGVVTWAQKINREQDVLERKVLDETFTNKNTDLGRKVKPFEEQYRRAILTGKKEVAAQIMADNQADFNKAGITSKLLEWTGTTEETARQKGRTIAEDVEKDRVKAQGETLDAALNDLQLSGENLSQQQETDIRDVAAGLNYGTTDVGGETTQIGAPIDFQTGQIDYSRVTPEQATSMLDALDSQGTLDVDSTQTVADQVSAFVRDNPGMPNKSVLAYEKAAMASAMEENNLSELQVQDRDREVTTNNTTNNIDGNRVASAQNNPNNASEITQLLNDLDVEDSRLGNAMDNADYGQVIMAEIVRLTEEGVPYGDDGDTIVLGASQLGNILRQVTANWSEIEIFNGMISDIAADYIDSPGFKRQADEYINWKAEDDKITAKYSNNTKATPGAQKNLDALNSIASRPPEINNENTNSATTPLNAAANANDNYGYGSSVEALKNVNVDTLGNFNDVKVNEMSEEEIDKALAKASRWYTRNVKLGNKERYGMTKEEEAEWTLKAQTVSNDLAKLKDLASEADDFEYNTKAAADRSLAQELYKYNVPPR